MGRLIAVDELNAELRNTYEHEKDVINSAWRLNMLIDKVDEIPTAYDLDKVVRQLEEYSNADEAERLGTMPVVELADAIKIVEGGGADAKTDS